MKKTFLTLLGSFGLMLVPFIAMQLSDEVNWSLSDFIIGGLMLFGLGMLLQFLISKLKGKKIRIFVIIAVILIFVLVWIELAVGIFN